MQVLRTRFVASADGLQQILLPAAAVSMHSTEIATNGSPLITQRSAAECELRHGSSLATAWLQAATAPFDLYSDPLVRFEVRLGFGVGPARFTDDVHAALACPDSATAASASTVSAQVFRLSAQEHVLMVVQHHSITDVISLQILGRDLSAAYQAALHRTKPQWPPLSVAYIDYAAWQRANLGTAALEAELAWWRQTLAGAPALLEWQTDRPRPSTMSFAGAQLHFSAPAAVCQGVQQLAAAQQTTPFVVVLTALQVMTGTSLTTP